MVSTKPRTFLGLDLSTQQLKVIAVDNELGIIHEEFVNFDKDLPEFATQGGVKRQEDALTVTVPTLLWVKAFDLLLERIKSKGFCFENVTCISGTGQQHGSVYWKNGARMCLNNLNPDKGLNEQLKVLRKSWDDSGAGGAREGQMDRDGDHKEKLLCGEQGQLSH